jgi:ATP-binding cassette, subfamily B, multidrug efflux pump
VTTTQPQPESGERLSTRDQSLSRLPFQRGPAMVQTKDAKAAARQLLGRLRSERHKLIVVMLTVTTGVGLTVYGPRLLGEATDIIITGTIFGDGVDFPSLTRTLLLAVGVYVAGSFLSWVTAWTMAGVVQRTMSRLRTEVEDKIHRLPLSYVDKTPRGDLLSRVTNDIDNIAQGLQMSVSQSLNQLLMIVGVLAMMFWISPLLTIFAVVLIPASLWLVKTIMTRSRTRFMAQWRHTGELNAIVEESFTGHTLVKVFGRQRDVEEKFAGVNDELFEASYKAQFVVGITQPIMMFLGNLNYLVIAVIGALRITQGAISIGDLQAFIQYARMYTQPLAQLAGMLNMIQSALASAERVFELIDAPDESPEPETTPELDGVRGRVTFENATFSYDPNQPLIEDLSLVAEPGQTIAIVGPTGAGKTTLVNLIMRFYDLAGGQITLDDHNVMDLRRQDLRSQLGMVLQDTWLFEGTIWDNIKYGNQNATDERILEASKAAYVDRFVHHLPNGYETMVDEDGGNLSAGEKQLLTIARAFLSDPAILILDEATSSVDTRTEMLIQEAMAALRSDRTSFVIAHRLSTIRDADLILMMKDGQIVEQGSHEELIARQGAYYDLYQSQFRAPAVEVTDPPPKPMMPPRPPARPSIPM